MNVKVISDLHGNLPDYKFLNTDLLCICGDISPLYIQRDFWTMKNWLCTDFTDWCNELNVKKIIFIAGNHDGICEYNDEFMHKKFPKDSKVTYLKDELYEYECDGKTYRIYGTPHCVKFCNWYFNKSTEELEKEYQKIPENLDILLSHDAPNINNLGTILQEDFSRKNLVVGNDVLSKYIKLRKPKYCFCGHIHSGNHELTEFDGIKLCNASILNEFYKITYKPIEIQL